jgi:hypothetical protein
MLAAMVLAASFTLSLKEAAAFLDAVFQGLDTSNNFSFFYFRN